MTNRTWWIWLGGIVILGGIYRLCYVIYSPQPQVIYDATTYSAFAKNLLQYGIYSVDGINPSAFYTPGYPLFLSLIYFLFGTENFLAVRVVQAIISTITLWLWILLAQRFTKNRWVMLTVAIAAVIYPPFIWANGLILTEVLATFWLSLWLITLPVISQKNKSKALLINGVILGILTMIRPTPSLGLIFLGVWWLVWQRDSWRLIIKNVLLIGLGSILVMLPWWGRNFKAFHSFIPFSAESGNVFLIGTYYNYNYSQEQEKAWPQTTTEVGTDTLKTNFAIQRIKSEFKAQPFAYLKWYAWDKARFFWFQIYMLSNQGLLTISTAIKFHSFIAYGALLGMFWWLHKRKEDLVLGSLIAFLIYYQLIHQVFVAIDRLSFPIVGAAMVLSGWFYWEIKDVICKLNKKHSWNQSRFFGFGLILLLILILANHRLRQPSLLQYFNPNVVYFFSVSRYLGIFVLITTGLAHIFNLSLKNWTRRKWEIIILLFTAVMITPSLPNNAFISSPGCLAKSCLPELDFVKLNSQDKITRVIDLPSWFDPRLKTQLFIFARSPQTKKVPLIIKYDGKKLKLNIRAATTTQYYKTIQIESGKKKIRFEIVNLGDYPVEIALNWRKNYGLSAWGDNFNDLSAKPGKQPGTYLIGLTQAERKPFPVNLWYGSSNFSIRRNLLIEARTGSR